MAIAALVPSRRIEAKLRDYRKSVTITSVNRDPRPRRPKRVSWFELNGIRIEPAAPKHVIDSAGVVIAAVEKRGVPATITIRSGAQRLAAQIARFTVIGVFSGAGEAAPQLCHFAVNGPAVVWKWVRDSAGSDS